MACGSKGGWVTGFTRRGVTQPSYHFIGMQVVNASVFAPLADGVPAETVMQLYPELIGSRGDAIAAHFVDASFQDMGNPAEYLQTSLDLASVEGDRLVSAGDVIIDPAARVSRTAVSITFASAPAPPSRTASSATVSKYRRRHLSPLCDRSQPGRDAARGRTRRGRSGDQAVLGIGSTFALST